ncbi:hypothetical protein OSTOST_06809 [Ostertagia ostertagi]
MLEHEVEVYEDVKAPEVKKYWLPVNWAVTLIARARNKEFIADAPSYSLMMKELITFRTHLALLCNYDWVPIPIAYPQVVFLAVRSYFIICLVSRQFLIGDGAPNAPSVRTNGNLKAKNTLRVWTERPVAEALLNPLGEDDDDFECNFLINRNTTIGMAIVDRTAGKCPEMTYDTLSNTSVTKFGGGEYGGDHALVGSVADVVIPPEETPGDLARIGSFISSARSSARLSRKSTSSEIGRSVVLLVD